MTRAIDALRADEIINVDRSNMRFRTIHGDFASQKVPYVAELHDRVLRIVNLLAEDTYGPLQQRDIGLSLNVTPPGGRFGCHYDRNRLTAVFTSTPFP